MSIFADTQTRDQDMVIQDPWFGTERVFFGPAGVIVGVPIGTDPAKLAHYAGWHAKNGTDPADMGVTVQGVEHLSLTEVWDAVYGALGATDFIVAQICGDAPVRRTRQ